MRSAAFYLASILTVSLLTVSTAAVGQTETVTVERWTHCVARTYVPGRGTEVYYSKPFLALVNINESGGGMIFGLNVHGVNVDECVGFINKVRELDSGPIAGSNNAVSYDSKEDADTAASRYFGSTLVDREPKGDSGARRKATVSFREPQTVAGENGFGGVTFNVEYQFLACSGELHIAYSLVENSVGIGRLVGGDDRLLTSDRSGRANYWHEGQVYKVQALPETILNLPLRGSVWVRFQDRPLGTFADDHAGKALGFGCFSGQTKKVADLKDLKTDLVKEPTKEELAKLFDQLRVDFKTVQMLTSSAAEEEIRSGLAQKAAGDNERSGQAGLEAASADRALRNAEADARSADRAAREAEFQARMKAYEEGVAENKAAVEKYEAEIEAVETQKAASAERAKAVQEEFARQQAAYQAELRAISERNAQAQAEYEAQVGKADVSVPKN